MRVLLPLLTATVFALSAHAQPTSTQSTSTQTITTHTTHHSLTTQQRFDQANTTHDGHLTLDQAKTGYKSIARHFAAIDQDKKGYITEDDIRAYNKTQRTLHHQSASARSPNG